ncbi:DNA/RNA non-specific endonuclease [Cupriavidus basilensis]|uniref:DNA/RNA non-specific endonuclease n=1 Tax=Cupriavidus basilensis TaxID=68895 RepID=UPI0023E8D3DC|nr:DNA/RNA non-specific endonuclease [Cupriavidus basilensis]MDF3886682.1 DNA/RNA non-specific endonuclease [Cupriavidus basilensis]
MSATHEEKLRTYLARLAPSGSLDELIADSAATEAASREAAPEAASAAGQERQLLEKLALRRPLDAREQYKVEAIIIPDKRPAIDIRKGDFEVSHPLWRHWNEPEIKVPVRRAIQSVGRIELPGHPRLPYGGTGFVVGRGLLMTNRHVAEIFARGIGQRKLAFIPGLHAAIDFLHERDRPDTLMLDVRGIVMIHPYWDMALLQVEGLGPQQAPLSLDPMEPEALAGRQVALIGYPAFDQRNPADVQDDVFQGVYEVKRLKPGVVDKRDLVYSYGATVNALTHNASTLGGDSGSPVVDARTGDVVALHFAGTYLVANYGVPAYELARDSRVVDAGVQFTRAVSPGPIPWDNAWREADAGEAAQAPAVARSAAGTAVGAAGVFRQRATINLPIEITVSIAPFGLSAADAASVTVTTEKAVEPIHDTDYSGRSGYDERFLGKWLAMPKPIDDTVLARTSDGGTELKYQHFSILMHGKRRIALLSASNLDTSPLLRRPELRPDKAYTRDGLGGLSDKDTERWFRDDRIRPTEQLSDKFFNQDRQAFDKGHLVRREDVAWGESYDDVQRANGDTYHITNCTPQVKTFNRSSTPGTDTNWGDLENYVMRQAKTERVSLFSGPVFDDADETFVGVSDEGPVRVKIPSRFWKVAVVNDSGTLKSFAFLLEQDLSDVQAEFVVTPAWRPFMVPLSDLEQMTGLRFAQAMHAGDQFVTGEGEGIRRVAGLPSIRAASRRTDAAAALTFVEPLLDQWREAQRRAGSVAGTAGVRFVLNFPTGRTPSDSQTERAVRDALGLDVRVAPMFAADPELDRHRLMTVATVPRADRSDLFELARALRGVTAAETVDPDLATDYYDWDRALPTGSESANVAFWCWAGDADSPRDPDWAIVTTGVPEAWQLSEAAGRTSRGAGIRIFQPDTGVVPSHRELPPGIAENPGAISLLEPGSPPIDPMNGGMNPGHGTCTSSVVASPEAGRMRGAAPLATLVPVRCVESVAVFDQSYVAQAIDHARRNGAHVITMSLGGVFSSALHAALKRAVQANIIVVAAAGNCVGTVVWPARYEEAIAVGGTNAAMKPWRGSSRGSAVDVSGPAEFVLRADPRVAGDPAAVSPGQGTSFATAHLAGVAALWLAHHDRDALIASLPDGVTLQQVFRTLTRASATVPPDFDTDAYGAGIVNAQALLARDPSTAFGHESVYGTPHTDMRRQLAELLAEATGAGGLESAAPAMDDPQNAPELACLALDNIRTRRSSRVREEALPPIGISPGLRRALGDRSIVLSSIGRHHV